MLSEAAHRHPELRGRTQHHQLPAALPFFSDSFDLVISVAVIMHLPEREIPGVFGEIARVLVPGGTVAYSVNRARPGLDAGGNDPKGRHFTCLSSDAWEELHRRAGFRTVTGWESEDITGRPGISWVTFICKKE